VDFNSSNLSLSDKKEQISYFISAIKCTKGEVSFSAGGSVWFASFIRSARVSASMSARSTSSALTFSPLMSPLELPCLVTLKGPFPRERERGRERVSVRAGWGGSPLRDGGVCKEDDDAWIMQ
jgi:hypothetical protein